MFIIHPLFFFYGGVFLSVNLLSGPPGSGKSVLVTYSGIDALLEHKNVIANYPFDMTYFRRKKHIGKFVYIQTQKLTPQYLIRFAAENHDRKGRKRKRCQTIVLIDEAEMIFNPREWKNGERINWIYFLANSRHFNYDIYLVCPEDKMIDKQIRGVITTEWKCRSLTAFGIVGKIINFCFGGLFCAVQYNYSAKVKLFPPHFYRLHRRKADVFDTMRMFEGMAGYDEIGEAEENGEDIKRESSNKKRHEDRSVVFALLRIGLWERIQAACKI